ncbi:MAG: recombinase family protein [Actinomycetota bacterium]|nr:recombinase family protein [Actinomycetota bacterium]
MRPVARPPAPTPSATPRPAEAASATQGPREDEQRTVRRIVELRRAGQTYRAIAASLDSEGLRPRRAGSWSAAAVRNITLRELPT